MKYNQVFLATSASGLARATADAEGVWSVEALLEDQKVNCLAADPRNEGVI